MGIRIFLSEELRSGKLVELSSYHSNYLFSVMRLQSGDCVKAFNAIDGEWEASIIDISKRSTTVEVIKAIKLPKTISPLYLAFCPIKNVNSTFISQKATELGVTKIFPIITERTIVKKINIERMKMAAIEASEQCERLSVPEIFPEISLKSFLCDYGKSIQIIFCDELRENANNISNINHLFNRHDKTILIGPEGGFSNNERKIIRDMEGVIPIHLGKRILRAETAIISSLSLYQALYGDWCEK